MLFILLLKVGAQKEDRTLSRTTQWGVYSEWKPGIFLCRLVPFSLQPPYFPAEHSHPCSPIQLIEAASYWSNSAPPIQLLLASTCTSTIPSPTQTCQLILRPATSKKPSRLLLREILATPYLETVILKQVQGLLQDMSLPLSGLLFLHL